MEEPRKQIWVSPNGDGWKVHVPGNSRASGIFDKKTDAVQKAAAMGRSSGNAQVLIQRQDGTIQDERTYGKDPFPPRG